MCPKYHYSLISEELKTHGCSKPTDCRIMKNIAYFLVDGKWPPVYKFDQPMLDSQKNNRKFDRTLKQYPYNVHVPYLTVW